MKSHRILLIGPMGSGKSRLMGFLSKKGYATLQVDRINHDILMNDSNVHSKILQRWSDQVMSNNILDKKKIAKIVFNDLAELEWLSQLTHPLIYHRVNQWALSKNRCVVEFPLPPKVDLLSWDPDIWALIANKEVRLTRALSDFEAVDVKNRMKCQPNDESYTSNAHHVISNEGSISDLYHKIEQIIR